MAKPPGLKVHRALFTPEEVAEVLAHPEMVQPRAENPQLFRLFGDFGANKEADEPAPWMLAWGERLTARGLFSARPTQYRLCDWIGDLEGQFKWHTDNDRHGQEILAVALSPGRRIGFRDPNRPAATFELDLDLGDAYLMTGKARWSWEHRVLPRGRERSGGKSFILSYRRSTS